jgi:hypothetical protein
VTDDGSEVAAEADRTVFTVVSPRGIGAATIRRRQPHGPAAVVLRIVLAGECLELRRHLSAPTRSG